MTFVYDASKDFTFCRTCQDVRDARQDNRSPVSVVRVSPAQLKRVEGALRDAGYIHKVCFDYWELQPSAPRLSDTGAAGASVTLGSRRVKGNGALHGR